MTTLTLGQVHEASAGNAYPCSLLAGRETALVLFAAGFYGRQDAYWVAAAGLTATCVDIDTEKLSQMENIYPAGWEFIDADAYAFVGQTDRRWDVVSVDCPTGQFTKAAENVGLWCGCANHLVVLGVGIDTRVQPPLGWRRTDRRRRSDNYGGVFWDVLERVNADS